MNAISPTTPHASARLPREPASVLRLPTRWVRTRVLRQLAELRRGSLRIEDDIDHEGVLRILSDAGIGLPSYYEWRTRSGCYFCFYQRKAEWIGLADRHPDLFERAIAIEAISVSASACARRVPVGVSR